METSIISSCTFNREEFFQEELYYGVQKRDCLGIGDGTPHSTINMSYDHVESIIILLSISSLKYITN